MLRRFLCFMVLGGTTILTAGGGDPNFRLEVAFSDDFERGSLGSNWVNSGAGIDWGIDASQSHSPTRSAADSPYQEYPLSPTERWMAMASGMNLTDMVSCRLEYWTYYVLRQNKDYCHVQVSEDGGANWQDVEVYTGSGSSGWEFHNVDLSMFVGHMDVKVRFMLSVWRSGQPKDGWYIDDVAVSREARPRHDCGASDILAPPHFLSQRDTVYPTGLYSNFGNQQDTVYLHFGFSGGLPVLNYHESLSVVLPVGACTSYVLPRWIAASLGAYHAKAWTSFAGDEDHSNDTAYYDFEVLRPLRDVAPYRISAPAPLIHPTPVRPAVWVRNLGTEAEQLEVSCRIAKGPDTVFAAAESLRLLAGDTTQLVFDEWPASYGVYRAIFRTRCAADQVAANDTIYRDFSVDRYDHDVGATSIVSPVDSCMAGPVTPSAIVRNYGLNSESFNVHFEVRDSLGNQVRHWQVPVKELAGDDTRFASFLPVWNATYGSYTLCCYTDLGNDQNDPNDTIAAQLLVRDPRLLHDAAVVSIASPLTPSRSGWLTPQAWVMNCGLLTESFNVSFLGIDSLGLPVYSQSVPVANLTPEQEVLVTFPPWSASLGWYDMYCWSDLFTDMSRGNDTVNAALLVTDTGLPLPLGGWIERAPLPPGSKNKRVKDGAALAYSQESGQQLIYAFKGNNTCEFYRYLIPNNAWFTHDSIPRYGRSSKKKAVKKGGTLVTAGGKLYATKGGGTLDFWQFDPVVRRWTQLADVPAGGRGIRDGVSSVSASIAGIDYIYFLKSSNTFEFYRYNVATAGWETLPQAPLGSSHRSYKAGSAITYSPDLNRVYVLKGTANEVFSYSPSGNDWRTLDPLPLIGNSVRPKKAKDGACLAYRRGAVYALKGGNTNEFFTFRCDSGKWYAAPDVPYAMGNKKVKAGGALVYGWGPDRLYATKGTNTLEFYAFVFDTLHAFQLPKPGGIVSTATRNRPGAISVLPNPTDGRAWVSYDLPVSGRVAVRLYDVVGTLRRTFAEGYQPAGRHNLQLDCCNMPCGVYLLHYEDASGTTTRKLVVER